MLLLFWISLFAVFYAYLGYPLLLVIVSIFFRRELSSETLKELPTVSLLISAYNEEKVIRDKLENSLSLDYPKEMLEIVVVSDGSDDNTEEIVKRYTERGIILRSYPGRIGKTACLNEAVPQAKGDIVVFSDANAQFDSHAIKEMVKHFMDPKIGFVTGRTRYISQKDNFLRDSIGLYSRIETFTKKNESKISSCVGADGAIFALRKRLFRLLRADDINDLVIPLSVIRQGYRGILAENAFCLEQTSGSISGEFNRQTRIASRTLRALFSNLDLTNPFRYTFFSFELLSHKMIRYFVPLLMVTLFLSNLALAGKSRFYIAPLAAQIVLYIFAWLGHKSIELPRLGSVIRTVYSFAMTNAAIAVGWVKYFRNENVRVWSTSRNKAYLGRAK